ncbi:MOSC domain-containing protein [Chloroflexota bacterium]
MASVIAVCTSNKKGVIKKPVAEGVFTREYGMEGDAHADSQTHRQVSLLAAESIQKMCDRGFELKPGNFAENITTEGVDLKSLPLGSIIRVGSEVVLKMTQLGKECHTGCAIRKLVGDCIMPAEGIFARVITGGKVKPNDTVLIENAGLKNA